MTASPGKKQKENTPARGAGVVIAGNMNVGKTALFKHMCGGKTTSVNIPGNTVSVASGRIRGTDNVAFDTPGVVSMFSTNEDERAGRDVILSQAEEGNIQGLILVADAKNLRRSIAIALQHMEYGLPMLLDLNMIDEAVSRGIDIDHGTLSQMLGLDVVTTIAREGIGVSKVISGIKDMKTPAPFIQYPAWMEKFLAIAEKLLQSGNISPRVLGLLLLVGDEGVEDHIERRFGRGMLTQLKHLADEYRMEDPQSSTISLVNLYNRRAEQIAGAVQKIEPPSKNPFLVKFGDWCTQFKTGIPIAMAALYLVYLFVGTFGATFLVDTLNETLFEGFLIPWAEALVQPIPSAFIRDMIVDPEFGILPTGVFLALGLVLPVLFCFYIAFGILEDSGYLPRISILLDRVFQKMGLNGKGVIPLVMGFSCVTMAILTTRMLDTKKEKNIATFLLLLGMPCAPLLAVMFIILGKMPVTASVTVFGIIFLQIFVAGFVANRLLPGKREPFLMEISPMRWPKLDQIVKSAAQKTYFFMKEAIPVFILASLCVFLLQRAGGLAVLERLAEPVVSGFMGLPEKSVQVFIKTIIRRESGAAEIGHLSALYTNLQLVVNLLVMTFLLPCMNAAIVLFKERGIKAASAIIATVMVYAIIVGSLVNFTCRAFGITFS